MAWSWSHFPKRLFRDGRFLRLDDSAQSLLLRLYASADRWGRGPTDPDELAVVGGALLGIDDFAARLERLRAAGLVRLSVCGTAWQIDRYDDDAPKDVLKGRPRSDYPEPGDGPAKPANPGPIPEPPGVSGKTPEKPLKAGRQAGRRSIAPLGSPPGTPPGSPGKSEPAPSAPTAARERACAHEGGPCAGASSPALGGAGEAPQGPVQDPEQPPKPVPRKRVMSREEERERMRVLREQAASLEAPA